MAYWVFEETTASKSLFLQCFLAAAAFFLCPHPLPAGLFLAIMIYVSLLHRIFNCGTLPCLVPVAQFLPSSVITGVLASHPALHLTGTHHFQILQSVGHKQPFMGSSLVPALTFISAPQLEADTWALFPWVQYYKSHLCHLPYVP